MAVIDRFAVHRAMRLNLAGAPNGTITGDFPENATDKALADAFVTPGRVLSKPPSKARHYEKERNHNRRL